MFKVALISDTHGRHESIYQMKEEDSLDNMETLYCLTGRVFLPNKLDCIIHAGDVSMSGTEYEIEKFLKWFSSVDAKYRIFCAGNHDFLFDRQRMLAKELLAKYPEVIYIENEMVEIEGIKIWGSPIQPWFHNWAFNKYRGEDIKKYWDLIPDEVDILVTHGPPYGVLDMCQNGDVVGCEDLMEKVQKVKPKIHMFGHIHEAAGHAFKDEIHFVNASVLNLRYQLQNKPVIFEIDKDKNVKLYNPMEAQTKIKFTFFWGGTFSQWAPSKFTIDGITFTHAEQYMMYKKAMLFSDTETAAEIMKAEHPREQKALGRKVKNFDKAEWEKNCKQYVYDANYAKFTQNEKMFKVLMDTGDTELVEASPEDTIWGIGLAEEDSRAQNKETWLGTNWLGEAITKVREDLKKDNSIKFPSFIKPEISIEDFSKADVRLCQILSVEKVAKKDRLYKLTIDTGIDKRTVVSSIALLFKPEELQGKTLPFVLNLPPREIAGIESRGMIILADAMRTGEVLQIASNTSNVGVGATVI